MVIENYPIPKIDYILNLLGKYIIFSKLNIKSGFWHIEICARKLRIYWFYNHFGHFSLEGYAIWFKKCTHYFLASY